MYKADNETSLVCLKLPKWNGQHLYPKTEEQGQILMNLKRSV